MAKVLYINLNPLKRRTGDCVYRAMARFLGVSWRQALDDLVCWAADRGLTNFNFRSTYNEFLSSKGFRRHRAPKKGITVEEFCAGYAEKGKLYILSCPRHLTIADWPEHLEECIIVDTWDCSKRNVDGFWVRDSFPYHPSLLNSV